MVFHDVEEGAQEGRPIVYLGDRSGLGWADSALEVGSSLSVLSFGARTEWARGEIRKLEGLMSVASRLEHGPM